MRALATCVIALGLITSPAMAGAGRVRDKNTSAANTGNDSTANSVVSTAPAADSNTAAPAKAEASSVEIELDQLRDLVESQTKQLQEQQLALAALEAKLNAGSAVTPADAVPAAAPMAAISTPVAPANAAAGKAQADTTGPASISYKGITLTPGGFMAAETVWRQKALASDINTPFNSVPFAGASQAHMSEFNASGRQSRISMLVQGSLPSVKIGGYYEMDFLSAGVTSNNNQSNSYTMRQRQFWGQAAFTNGFTVTGGQQWSLLTETTNGMDNRTEALPMVIDAQYTAGFSWARQFGMRFVKNFNNKVWLGMSVEESQATLTTHGNATVNTGGTQVVTCTNPPTCTTTGTAVVLPTTLNNFLLGAFGTSGGLYNTLGNYAFNPAPDLVFKAVFQPGFGHYEIFGVLSQFRDRAFPCVATVPLPANCTGTVPAASAAGAFNSNATGGGIGGNAR